MLRRLARDRPVDVIKAKLSLSFLPIIADAERARRMLFPPSMPVEEVCRYHRLLQDESVLGYLDCLVLDLVDAKRVSSPILVMGGGEDAMVTPEEVASTANTYGVEPTLFEHVAHDMMLDPAWRAVADKIICELETLFPERRTREGSRRKAA
jgi:hypothetical protein